ncbi:MAG: DNA repair protein RecN [Lachnospiraceae bacterium]|nr:DNA repair protein RecN [Lachnospiraceae bacterium]
MLVSLHVKNLALIDETEVTFQDGLNILTGETGAGKSVIIGSVNLALGGRADKEMIRTGAEYALVELIFQISNPKQIQMIQEMDIPMEEDGTLLIQRKIMANRNVSKAGGENVTSRTLKDLAGVLIDIHGQHEHQSLFHIKKHMELLDDFGKAELEPVKTKIREVYHAYGTIKQQLSETVDDKEKEREIALAEFEVQEIADAKLQPGEDETLEADYMKMVNSRKIASAMGIVHGLTGSTEGDGAGELMGRAARELRTVTGYDPSLEDLEETLIHIDNLLNDFNRSISDYMSDMEFDEEDFARAEERLNRINHLKSKYGDSIEKILAYEKEQNKKLENLRDYEQYRTQLQTELEKKRDTLDKLCGKASTIRKKYAIQLAERMTNALLDLNFLEVRFEIQVRPKEGEYTTAGYDEVEFMISTNPGEPIKSLCNVASGGELSRIMLALKTVLAEKDEIETLIFDEIDAGISGKTAWKVSEQLAILGKNHQIISITHLPQIAAMADTHFVISKRVENGTTVTNIERIESGQEIQELARLLGGEMITDAVVNNAKEMKDLAMKHKQMESKF